MARKPSQFQGDGPQHIDRRHAMTADIERGVRLSKWLFVWPQIGMDSWDLGLKVKVRGVEA